MRGGRKIREREAGVLSGHRDSLSGPEFVSLARKWRQHAVIEPRECPRLVCLEGDSEVCQEPGVPRDAGFTATDQLEFLKASEGMRRLSLMPGLSDAAREAFWFLSSQTRRLAKGVP